MNWTCECDSALKWFYLIHSTDKLYFLQNKVTFLFTSPFLLDNKQLLLHHAHQKVKKSPFQTLSGRIPPGRITEFSRPTDKKWTLTMIRILSPAAPWEKGVKMKVFFGGFFCYCNLHHNRAIIHRADDDEWKPSVVWKLLHSLVTGPCSRRGFLPEVFRTLQPTLHAVDWKRGKIF